MCAQFDTLPDVLKLIQKYKAKPNQNFDVNLLKKRILPHSLAPVIVKQNGELVMKLMKFSLLPSWSKESKIKFATHNARLESILEKATWKKPFLTQHCLVPLTQFVEPIYEGEHGGFMVDFFDSNQEIITAAGVYDTWVNKQTGEIIESFAIITKEPDSFIKNTGHDRSPVFLNPIEFDAWLDVENSNPQKFIELLKNSKCSHQWSVQRERALKSKLHLKPSAQTMLSQ